MIIKLTTKISNDSTKQKLGKILSQFKACSKELFLNDNDKKEAKEIIKRLIQLKTEDWAQYIEKITNFNEIFDFDNELSKKLKFKDLKNKIGQHFGELDCAKQLIREFPKSKIEKLRNSKKTKRCDFKVTTEQKLVFIEVKTITKLAKKNLSDYAKKALSQIKTTTENHQNRFGAVWIFTYDTFNKPTKIQKMAEEVKNELNNDFSYTLTVQVYNQGIYGDAYF